MSNALKFKHTHVPRQNGELARFKVIQGPDYGAVYVIVGPKALIGRGEENDIVISDLKASRVHAELSSTQTGWVIRDKGSANGILFNGKATREARIKLNDSITVGETSLEFVTSEAGTMMLVAPPRTIDQVQAEQKFLSARKDKMEAMGLSSLFGNGSNPAPAASASDKNKNIRIIVLVLVLGGGFLFLGDDNQPKKPVKKTQKKEESRDLASYLPNPEVNRASETLFKDGLREYFAGNYSRARSQFETVLQISPGHTLATLYLENCDNAVKEDVKIHLEYGKKSLQSGKLRDAKAHFERILRLLNRDRSNPAFLEAEDQLKEVKKQINNGKEGKDF
jgi:pSer/pThr/pTyr-binding forkhead associated (FHA) protein